MFKLIKVIVVVQLWSHLVLGNVLGTDSQSFNPINDGLDFVTVHSSKVLTPGTVNLGLFFNSASNSLPLYSGQSSQTLTNSRDRLYSFDLNAAYGFWPSWELGISSPYLFRQEIENCVACTFFENSGFTETRIFVKNGNYRLASWGFAWVASLNRNLIEQNPFAGEGSGLTSNLEIAVDRRIGEFEVAANLGHRWRQIGDRVPANALIGRVPNQVIYSFALSYYKSSWASNLIGEIFGSQPSQHNPDGSNFSKRSEKAMEALLGLKHQWSHNLAIHAGAGTALIKGFGTPDLRLYTGINYSFGVNQKPEFTTSESLTSNQTPQKIYTLWNLSFEFDSTTLTKVSEQTFNQIVKTLLEMPSILKVEIEGHTDSIGNETYNLNLSQKRSEELKARLEELLKSKSKNIQITAVGYGESRPLVPNTNFQGRATNRRVVFNVFTDKTH